ncbi:ArsC/Spx/MgsR family protein [Ornithobacterium rhinotracheale]|uniref:ArsC/Spx/MgsR family protein n=1 Tax=Ornithobacterium rhinotracheale TaxID=28251 RepID=UPI004036AD08
MDLVRTNEDIWKENYKGKDLTDEQIISAIVENPKLLERPIVINGDRAVVARPTEKIDEILD